ncbi:MAG: TGS domain-containing protein [Candidatus Aenigmarchaeota archaeon]|nr:TGS domain-containing protein [Candidatus Aenigmarchaeota archaeon]
MPTNVTIHYAKAQEKYIKAKTREEKIAALEEMIKEAPSHKGGENLRKELKQRLARLRQKKEASTSRRSFMIPKKGDAQICILGATQSGKSTLLSKLTNAKPKITSHAYTTEKPEIGTCDYLGVKFQMIEIPSTYRPVFMSIAHCADALVLVYNKKEELKEVREVLEGFRIQKPFIEVSRDEDLDTIKEKLWEILGMIKIYTKEPGKKPSKKPMVMPKGSTVQDAARVLHNDFQDYFNFARVWGSSKYPGERVGPEYELEDDDILEVHIT